MAKNESMDISAFDYLWLDEDYSFKGLFKRIQEAHRDLWSAVHKSEEYPEEGSTIIINPPGHKLYQELSVQDRPSSLGIVLTIHGNMHDSIILSKQNLTDYEMNGAVPRNVIPRYDFFDYRINSLQSDSVTNQIGGIVLLGVLRDAREIIEQDRSAVQEVLVRRT